MTRFYFRIAMISGLVLLLACLWTLEKTRASAGAAPGLVVPASAGLFIEMDGMPDPVTPGDNITYTIGPGNSGPDAAVNVTLSMSVPANTTFQSLSAPPGWNCTVPPVGGTGNITCTTDVIGAGATAEFTLVVRVNSNAPGGSSISFTASVTSTTPDPDPSNNSDTIVITVASSCVLTCPGNITADSSPGRCGANLIYAAPTADSNCGPTACTPPSGSFFPVGSTQVSCEFSGSTFKAPAGSGCSFIVTVLDRTPPVVTCPSNITTGTSADKNTAVVDYPIASATDACGVSNVVCLPPSGSTFPLGTSTVTCTARDTSNNTGTCAFTVTVRDNSTPAIRCPDNITRDVPATQNSAVVNYSPPTTTGNATVVCLPPSGSTFPLGVSTVTCTALDVSGNSAACSFTVTLTGGPASIDLIIPTGQPNLTFPATDVRRKVKNRANAPCASFTIVSRGFAAVTLSVDSIQRIGADVANGRISDPREGDTYLLSLVNANGSERVLNIGDTLTLPAGGRLNFCLRFTPAIPPVTGNNSQLSAPQAIPDLVTSRVTFAVAGGGSLSVNVNGNVATGLQLINANNPRKPPTVTFTRSGDEFTVTFAIYDPNLDVNRARYEFFDGSGNVIAGPFDVDLTQAVRERNLVRGQSFTVTQRFTGADSNPNVSAIRVTVFDNETSVSSPTVALGTSASASLRVVSRRRLVAVMLPPARLHSPWPAGR